MTTADIRRGALNLRASAGLTETITVTWLDADGEPLDDITASSLWLGGSATDQDDFTEDENEDLTEIVGIVDDNVVTFEVDIPDDNNDTRRLRMTVDGELATIGRLFPSEIGSESLLDVTVRLGGAQVTVQTVGASSGGGGGGVTEHNDLTDRDAADAHPPSAITGLVDGMTSFGTSIAAHDGAIADLETAVGPMTARNLDQLVRPTAICSRIHIGDGTTNQIDPDTHVLDFPLYESTGPEDPFDNRDGNPIINGQPWGGGTVVFDYQADWEVNGFWDISETSPDVWTATRPAALNGWITPEMIAEGMLVWVGSAKMRVSLWSVQWSGSMGPPQGSHIEPIRPTFWHFLGEAGPGVTIPPDGATIVYKADEDQGVEHRRLTAADIDDLPAAGVPTSRQIAGLDLTVDRTAAAMRTALNVANGATANDTDANLKARANHTGTQLAATISDFASAVNALRITPVVKPSDTARTDAVGPIVPAADPHLTKSVAAGTYVVSARLPVTGGNNTPDIQVALTGGTVTFDVFGAVAGVTAAAAAMSHVGHSTGAHLTAGTGSYGTYLVVQGVCTLASPGSIAVSWAQANVSAQPTTVLAGATLQVEAT